MKRTLTSIVLGAALLVPCGAALATNDRPAEPRWGLRSERTERRLPFDFAEWLSRRFRAPESAPTVAPAPASPRSAPVDLPTPNEGDVVCPVPERGHCPVG